MLSKTDVNIRKGRMADNKPLPACGFPSLPIRRPARYPFAMTHLSTLYQQKIDAGELKPDAAQEAVLPHFDRIAEG